jgi:hypothetical protein
MQHQGRFSPSICASFASSSSENAPFLSSKIQGWYNGQFMAKVARDSVSPHPKNKRKVEKHLKGNKKKK